MRNMIYANNDFDFISACKDGNLNVAKNIYKNEPNINISACDEFAFRLACRNGHLNISTWLYEINHNINVSAKDEYAFRYACQNGHLEIAKWLYQINDNINISVLNEYAFRAACTNRHFYIAIWLYQIKPNININVINRAILIEWIHVDKLPYYMVNSDDEYDLKIPNYLTSNLYIEERIDIILTESIICSICINNNVNIQTNCSHYFCLDCISEWYTTNKECPHCRQNITHAYNLIIKPIN